MKFKNLFFVALLLFVSVIWGQKAHQETEKKHHHGHEFDGDFVDTVDPFGNPVKEITDPRNPLWESDVDDDTYELVTLEEVLNYNKAVERIHAKSGLNIVRVYLAVDEEYIAAHPDWFVRVLTIFQVSSAAYIRDANIFFIFAGLLPWQSDGSNNSQILADLASDFSGLPDGIVAGFTRDSNFTAGGKAYVYQNDPGLGFHVNYDQSINSTIYAMRHELGHNYGMGHDEDPALVCLMNYDYAYSVDVFDQDHEDLLVENRDRFGAITP